LARGGNARLLAIRPDDQSRGLGAPNSTEDARRSVSSESFVRAVSLSGTDDEGFAFGSRRCGDPSCGSSTPLMVDVKVLRARNATLRTTAD
jgi:hypothetical protein